MARVVARPSPVTDRVRALILSGERHAWSLEDLHEAARAELPTAVFSTIFRAVEVLERQGVVRRVDLGDGRVRYESAGTHHEHIKCTSCGTVEEVPGCVVEEATAGVQRRTRYVVTGHQVVFTGLCPRCVPRTPSGRRRTPAPRPAARG
jgi:Fe2+ or Zn2+ uptake regulation protein